MKSPRVRKIYHSDIVVVGSGVAGLTAALGTHPHRVSLITRGALGEGSSSILAQGGIAAALDRNDSPALHAADTLAVGCGLGNSDAIKLLTSQGSARIQHLIELGAAFDRDSKGQLLLGKEAAHSRRRIVHARGDATGAEVVEVLRSTVTRESRIESFPGVTAREIVTRDGRVLGLLSKEDGGNWIFHQAPAIVLATGGLGYLYWRTTNPSHSLGEGLALAARAGARLADLEFVQFHPTALAVDSDPLPLLTEALRGEGAVLLDESGHRFMKDEHPLAELAPRDVVARAIWKLQARGEQVFLDGTRAIGSRFPERFPTVYRHCQAASLDPVYQPIPVTPAAHYHIGGIQVDDRGRSSLSGLWACGEVASTGVHGANRLASNSLLEGLVFGARVASDLCDHLRLRAWASPVGPVTVPREGEQSLRLEREIRQVLWERVGLVRSQKSLEEALEALNDLGNLSGRGIGRLQNMLSLAIMVTSAALERRESRGVHYRSDFPVSRQEWEDRHLGWPRRRPAVREVSLSSQGR